MIPVLLAAALVTDVRTGATVFSMDAERPVAPLSIVKLYVAAVWWDHGFGGSLDDMLVDGRDQPGRDRAVELRKKLGAAAVLADLKSYGLDPSVGEAAWGDTLSIGEQNVTVTLPQLSRFLRTIATSQTESARKLRQAMLDCVARGTARGVAAKQAGFRLGGKTGTSATTGAFAGLVFIAGEPRYTVAVWLEGRVPGGGVPASTAADLARTLVPASCFILHEIGKGDIVHDGAACGTPLPPASTFKVPHALAALDAGVVDGPDARFAYDGSPQPFESWRRDQTLATAMRFSVVWVFQRIAERLGIEREAEYLLKLAYGNADPSSGLTTFWLGGSLQITPDEQRDFLLRLWRDQLPLRKPAMDAVRRILVQPKDAVVNATGEHPFPANGAVVSAKTGSSAGVRWLVGHVRKGAREWIFVSCVTGAPDANAAIDLAASGLRRARVIP